MATKRNRLKINVVTVFVVSAAHNNYSAKLDNRVRKITDTDYRLHRDALVVAVLECSLLPK